MHWTDGLPQIENYDYVASFLDGQLCSLKERWGGMHDLWHDGALETHRGRSVAPAWKQSELVMFPNIGPVDDCTLQLPESSVVFLDQHGISRALPWRVDEHLTRGNDALIRFVQEHAASDSVANPKYAPDKGNPRYMTWPFSTQLTKQFRLGSDGLEVDFWLAGGGEEPMPYQFGWHPAFSVEGRPDSVVFSFDGEPVNIPSCPTLADIVDASKTGAGLIRHCSEIACEDEEGRRRMVMRTTGFGHFMIWSPNAQAGMYCIEPVTHLPNPARQDFSDGDCRYLTDGEEHEYKVEMTFF